MRARIMYWTMDNCGRLQYTPQVVIHDATPQQAVLRSWANVRYRSRRILGEALEVVRLKTRSIWNRFFGGIYVNVINASTSTVTVHISNGTDTCAANPPSHVALFTCPCSWAKCSLCRIAQRPLRNSNADLGNWQPSRSFSKTVYWLHGTYREFWTS